MTASSSGPTTSPDKTSVSLIGKPCCQNGQYTFYKAFRYHRSPDQAKRVLMLGEFFFLRVPPHDDPCIGELQLLWEDRQRNQLLSSTRLYFLPEQSPDGRQSHHGEHEVLAASEKVTLKLTDLVSWITHQMDWIAGLHYHWQPALDSGEIADNDGEQKQQMQSLGIKLSSRAFLHNQNMMSPSRTAFLTSQRIISDRCQILSDTTGAATDSGPSSSSARGLDFSDVIEEKLKVNELHSDLESTVVILSYARYCRYRSLLKRIDGCKHDLLRQPYVQDALVELGIPLQRKCRVNILFCRDSFEHEGLLNNDLNCEHLTPRLKGKPRRRPVKSIIRGSSPESISSEESARANQPRRSRRAVTLSGLVSCAINYSESLARRNPRKGKQKRNLKRNNNNKAASGEISSNKNAAKNRRSKLKPEKNNSSSSGNDTDSSSVDANNNLTADTPTVVGSNVNRELREKVKTESAFLEELYKFMTERKTPIQRLPNLGFKKIDLYVFYTHAQQFGGYDHLTKEKLWKKLYDKMGGDRRSTSAATMSKRHYERLLLPFERHLNGHPDSRTLKISRDESLGSGASSGAKEEDEEADEERNETKGVEKTAEIAHVGSGKGGDISAQESIPVITESKEQLLDDDSKPPLHEGAQVGVVSEKDESVARSKKSGSHDGKELPVSTLSNAVSSLPKNKVTALVHPTQREKKSADIYDFNESAVDDLARHRQAMSEILLLKSALANNGHLSSPLHSISTLINQMPETAGNAMQLPSKLEDSSHSSASLNRPIAPDVNSFVRKAFPLPKPLESPNEMLISLKQTPVKVVKQNSDRSCTPLPAHSSHTISCESRAQLVDASDNDSKLPNRRKQHAAMKHVETPKMEILDLSTKKRCLEADSLTSSAMLSNAALFDNSEDILDLSVKNVKKKLAKKCDGHNGEASFEGNRNATPEREFTTTSTQMKNLNHLEKRTNKDSQKRPHQHEARDMLESATAESNKRVKSRAPFLSDNEGNRHRTAEIDLQKNLQGKRKASAVASPGNSRASTRHSSDAQSPVGALSGPPMVPSQQPSIAEYNPALPTFIRSPTSIWPGWPAPSSLSMPSFAVSPAAIANTAGLPPFHPGQLFFSGAMLPDTSSLINPFLSQPLFDPAKVMEAYASPLIMKSLIEQNQLHAGNMNALNSAFLQHLFTSSK